jgi:hypothetical protein
MGEKAIKSRFCGKKQKNVYFFKIRTIQNVFIYKNYFSITRPSKEAYASKSEP